MWEIEEKLIENWKDKRLNDETINIDKYIK